MKSVCLVSTTRADFGILKPLIQNLQKSKAINFQLVVTGTHLSKNYGMTIQEIIEEGIPVDIRIPIISEESTLESESEVMSKALLRFSSFFCKHRPDLLIVLGDRFETLAICCAAVNNRIPIAHIQGGETTEGAIDECYRHSISKMSFLHFAACEAYRKRIIQLGEDPNRVYNVGSMGVENALKLSKLTRDELSEQIGFDFNKPYALVTFHPVTLENFDAKTQCQELFDALDKFPELGFLFTKSNADEGGIQINDAIDAYVEKRNNCKAVFSLGTQRYLSALKYAKFVIGNSSSGILEAPIVKTTTINIGDRQRGRLQADSIVNCGTASTEIEAKILYVLSTEFQAQEKGNHNPYGNGNSSEKISEIIIDYLINEKIEIKKKFYDIQFEVK